MSCLSPQTSAVISYPKVSCAAEKSSQLISCQYLLEVFIPSTPRIAEKKATHSCSWILRGAVEEPCSLSVCRDAFQASSSTNSVLLRCPLHSNQAGLLHSPACCSRKEKPPWVLRARVASPFSPVFSLTGFFPSVMLPISVTLEKSVEYNFLCCCFRTAILQQQEMPGKGILSR